MWVPATMVLASGLDSSAIIGAKTLAQLDDNLAAVELTLTRDELAKLDEVSALPSEYPGWILERQGGARQPKPFKPAKP